MCSTLSVYLSTLSSPQPQYKARPALERLSISLLLPALFLIGNRLLCVCNYATSSAPISPEQPTKAAMLFSFCNSRPPVIALQTVVFFKSSEVVIFDLFTRPAQNHIFIFILLLYATPTPLLSTSSTSPPTATRRALFCSSAFPLRSVRLAPRGPSLTNTCAVCQLGARVHPGGCLDWRRLDS